MNRPEHQMILIFIALQPIVSTFLNLIDDDELVELSKYINEQIGGNE